MPNVTFPPGPVLMVVEAVIDPAHEADFNRWYDEQHLPEVVQCPGFRAGARYRSSDDKGPKYLAIYIMDSESAVETPELSAVRGWGSFEPHIRYERRIYRPIAMYPPDESLSE